MSYTRNNGTTIIKKHLLDVCNWMIERESDIDPSTCKVSEIYIEDGKLVIEISERKARC